MKQKYKTICIVSLVFILGLLSVGSGFVPYADAQQGGGGLEPCPPGQSPDPSGKCVLDNPAPNQLVSTNDFGQLLKDVIKYFLYFAGAIAVIFLMVGGFQYISSRGNEEAMERAKKTITAAIIGIVLIVMAFAIVAIINTLLTKPPPS